MHCLLQFFDINRMNGGLSGLLPSADQVGSGYGHNDNSGNQADKIHNNKIEHGIQADVNEEREFQYPLVISEVEHGKGIFQIADNREGTNY